jgi:Ca2+:H+ antiporter
VPALATRSLVTNWTTVVPVVAILVLAVTWGRHPPGAVVVLVALVLAAAVLAAVHHAEVIAHRVGEPFGSLVLAVAVTVIEVALIVTLMVSGGDKSASLARDTVFSAVIITCSGIIGLSLLVSTVRDRVVPFNSEGARAALSAITALVTLCLVLPRFTTSSSKPEFSGSQLAFAAIAALALYALFVLTQTVRHRDYFLPVDQDGTVVTDVETHAQPPSTQQAVYSLVLLTISLVGVVGLAKVESPSIESGVAAAGFPSSVVGVIIALLVLAPETLAAVRAARRHRFQTSLNIALGSAMASIGMTIPAVAFASIWLSGPIVLGLGSTQIVEFALTVMVAALTIAPGRATLMQSGVHLAVFACFVFFALKP